MENSLSAEGASCKRHRTDPVFTNVKVKGHYDFIATVCERVKRKWTNAIKTQGNAEKGVVIDVLKDMMNFILDAISLIVHEQINIVPYFFVLHKNTLISLRNAKMKVSKTQKITNNKTFYG